MSPALYREERVLVTPSCALFLGSPAMLRQFPPESLADPPGSLDFCSSRLFVFTSLVRGLTGPDLSSHRWSSHTIESSLCCPRFFTLSTSSSPVSFPPWGFFPFENLPFSTNGWLVLKLRVSPSSPFIPMSRYLHRVYLFPLPIMHPCFWPMQPVVRMAAPPPRPFNFSAFFVASPLSILSTSPKEAFLRFFSPSALTYCLPTTLFAQPHRPLSIAVTIFSPPSRIPQTTFTANPSTWLTTHCAVVQHGPNRSTFPGNIYLSPYEFSRFGRATYFEWMFNT